MHNNKKTDLILDSMQKLMQKKEAKSISVSDIAKEAGIGKGSIYYYFKSKEEYLAAIDRLAMTRDAVTYHEDGTVTLEFCK